jgi:perosamine synthetase
MNSIPVNKPLLDGNEKLYLAECIDTGWISSEGPFVAKFESTLAEMANREFGIAVSSGTAALEAAIMSLEMKSGDEVILPSFTIISCASAIVRAGLIPVVVDCDPQTWTMDVTRIEQLITQKTRAIMVVHIYGLPVDMEPVIEISEKYNLHIIEDAAEAIGQQYKERQCGSFGTVSAISFYTNKHITTGEGGMILTDNPDIASRCREMRNLCFKPDRRFKHNDLGWNYRMTNMQAAIGLAQSERIEEFTLKKRNMGRLYNELLGDSPYLHLPVASTSYSQNNYWVYGLVLKDNFPTDAEQVMIQLQNRGIGCRPFFWPLHEQPALHKLGLLTNNELLPISENIARRGFYIPSGLALTYEDIQAVVRILKQIIKSTVEQL